MEDNCENTSLTNSIFEMFRCWLIWREASQLVLKEKKNYSIWVLVVLQVIPTLCDAVMWLSCKQHLER